MKPNFSLNPKNDGYTSTLVQDITIILNKHRHKREVLATQVEMVTLEKMLHSCEKF